MSAITTAATALDLVQMQESGAPEFIDSKGLRSMFGLSRPHAYRLLKAGLIKSVSLRQRGAIRGKRLWVVESVRNFLLSCMDQNSNQSLSN